MLQGSTPECLGDMWYWIGTGSAVCKAVSYPLCYLPDSSCLFLPLVRILFTAMRSCSSSTIPQEQGCNVCLPRTKIPIFPTPIPTLLYLYTPLWGDRILHPEAHRKAAVEWLERIPPLSLPDPLSPTSAPKSTRSQSAMKHGMSTNKTWTHERCQCAWELGT